MFLPLHFSDLHRKNKSFKATRCHYQCLAAPSAFQRSSRRQGSEQSMARSFNNLKEDIMTSFFLSWKQWLGPKGFKVSRSPGLFLIIWIKTCFLISWKAVYHRLPFRSEKFSSERTVSDCDCVHCTRRIVFSRRSRNIIVVRTSTYPGLIDWFQDFGSAAVLDFTCFFPKL